MGKILTIRISLNTYDENDLIKFYPTLYTLAWPKDDKHIPRSQIFGVVELIDTLEQASQFANWTDEIKISLNQEIKKIFLLKEKLLKLILARQINEADALTYTIEESLQELEIKAKLLKIST